MQVRISGPAGVTVRTAVAVIAGAAVLVGAGSFIADLATHPRPEKFFFWQDDRVVDELTQLNTEIAQNPDDRRLAEIERRLAVIAAQSPLERQAVLTLIQVKRKRGEDTQADLLTDIASGMSRRDSAFEIDYIDRLTERGDARGVIDHFDSLIRAFPAYQEILVPEVALKTQDPAFRAAILEALKRNPPWRDAYFSELREFVDDKDLYLSIVKALVEPEWLLTDSEYIGHVSGLLRAGLTKDAYDAWILYNKKSGISVEYGIFDGTFSAVSNKMPFGWQFNNVKSVAKTKSINSPQSGGQSIRVDYFGGAVRQAGLQQVLFLRPGPHVFSGSVRSDDLNNPRGVVWRISCWMNNSTATTVLTATPPVQGTTPWRRFSVPFDVPATGCEAQMLRLEASSFAALDTMTKGTVFYTDFQITPAAAPADDNELRTTIPPASGP